MSEELPRPVQREHSKGSCIHLGGKQVTTTFLLFENKECKVVCRSLNNHFLKFSSSHINIYLASA